MQTISWLLIKLLNSWETPWQSMRRSAVLLFFLLANFICPGQPKQISIGIFSGITAPYTFDSGIGRDPRYEQKYQVKLSPVGLSYGIDYDGFGFVITPSLINIGQDANILNSVGGFEGTRAINMQYVQLPFSIKLHMIDLAFFKVSLVAGVSAGYLLKGSETITHSYAKYRFPNEVFQILPPDYIIEYDGVIAPNLPKMTTLTLKDFNKVQIFGSAGFRSDWDLTDAWRISFDLRANYGLKETRNEAYLARSRANQTLYELDGNRRELFASLTLGIAHHFEVDREKEGKSKSFGKYKPQRTPFIPAGKKRKPRR